MSNIDNRIVSMTFDNESFERNLAATVRSLDKLTESINHAGAQNGLSVLSDSVNDFDVSSMAAGIDNISSKFSALGAIGFTVIQDLTRSALDFVAKLGGNIIDPLIGGGKQRAENIEQAKFMLRGLGMDIEATMESAKSAVLGTAYGLDSAAKAAAQLGGSGLKAGEEMTGALRGIAGLASMTGSSYDEMADIFVSAAGQGKVSSMEFQRIGQRGVNAAAKLAQVWGTTEAEVRRMASEGEISFEMFAKGMDDAFGEHSQKANETYAGSLGNLRTAFSRMGASFFTPNLEQQRDLFNALSPAVDKAHEAVKPFINAIIGLKRIGIDRLIAKINGLSFSNFGIGMDKLSHAVGRAFFAVNQVFTMLKEAFREVFPPSANSKFVSFTGTIARLANMLIMNRETLLKLKAVFVAFFSILSIGWEVIKGIATVFFALAKGLWSLISPILGLTTGNLGFVKSLHEMLVVEGKIEGFFNMLADAVAWPFEAIRKITGAIIDFVQSLSLFDSDGGKTGEAGKKLSDTASLAERLLDTIKNVFSKISDLVSDIGGLFSSVFGDLGKAIEDAIGTGNFDRVIEIIKTSLLGGILYMLVQFFRSGIKLDFGLKDLLESVGGTFDALTGHIKSMQANVRADTIMKIAIAIGLLALSAIALSFVDSGKLQKSMLAIGAGLGALTAIMVGLEKMSEGGGALKIMAMGVALLFLAGAMTLLVIPILILSRMDTGSLIKGLGGVVVAMLAMGQALYLIGQDREGLVKSAFAMVLMAAALILLAKAVKMFAVMDPIDIAVGLVSIAVGLTLLVIAMNKMPKDFEKTSLGLLILAYALKNLAGVVQMFADLGIWEMIKGFSSIAIGLTLIGNAMDHFPKDMPAKAASLVLLSAALVIMGYAIQKVGELPFGELVKGVLGLTVMLGALAVAILILDAAKVGIPSLIAAAAGLYILGHAIGVIGRLPIDVLVQGLIGMAGALVVLGVASFLAPGIILLGIGLLAVGAGFALVGAGIALAGKGFELMAKFGGAAMGYIIETMQAVIREMPGFISAFVVGIIQAADEIAAAMPDLIVSIKEIILKVLEAIIEIVPQLAEAFGVLVDAGIQVFIGRVPLFVEAGFALLIGFLTGIRDNIGPITVLIVETIITGLETIAFLLGERVPTLMISLGVMFLTGLVSGFRQAVGRIWEFLTGLVSDIIGFFTSGFGIFSPSKVMMDIGINIIQGLLNGVVSLVGAVMNFFISLPLKIIGWIGNALLTLVSKGIDIIAGFLAGLGQKVLSVISWFGALPGKIVGWIGNVLGSLVSKGIQIIGGFLSGITDKIGDVTSFFTGLPGKIVGWIGNVGGKLVDIGKDLIGGLGRGISSAFNSVKNSLLGGGGSFDELEKKIREQLESNSPSRVYMRVGKTIPEGIALGISQDTTAVGSIATLAKSMTNKFQDTLSKIPVALAGMDDFNPTITPVLDLSMIQAGASGIGSIMGNSSIAADVSLSNARYISAISSVSPDASVDGTQATGGVVFNQNIYAPTELSANDIYRNTKSQIAVAKEELKI